mgnify:CR=1 FL=1
MIPSSKEIFWFFIGRLLVKMGKVSGTCPLIPDYIMEESQGLANGYRMFVIALANTLSSFLLGVTFDEKYIYYGTGLLAIIVSIFVIFGLRDEVKENIDHKSFEEKSIKVKMIEIKEESYFLLK